MARTPEQQAAMDALRTQKNAGVQAPAPQEPPTMRAPGTALAVPPYRPNWTTPNAAMGPQPPTTPGTSIVDPRRPNWTIPTAGTSANPEVPGTAPPAMRNNAAAADAVAPSTKPATVLGRGAAAARDVLASPAGQATLRAAGPALVAAPAALDTGTVLADAARGGPSTGIDVATQAAAGTGRTAAAAAGAMGGAQLGALGGPLAPVTVPLGALAGGAVGYYGADKAIKGMRGFLGADAADPVDRIAAQRSAASPNITDQVQARTGFTPSAAGAGRGSVNPLMGDQMPNTVMRDGNTFSGENIAEGFRYADGKPHTGTVTTLDMSEGRRQDAMELARLQTERAQREAGFAANQQGGGLSGFGGSRFGLRDAGAAGSGPLDALARSPKGKDRRLAAELASKREDLMLTEQGHNARTGMTVDAQRDATRTGANVTMRGQDMTQQNNLIQRQIALGERQYQRQKDAIEFGMKEREYQTGVQKTDFEQQAAREKSLQTKIEERNTTTGSDGKPVVDQGKARMYRETMDRAVARLGASGVHKLSPKDEEKLFAATDLLHRVQAESGLLPWKPDVLKTIDALDLTNLQRDPKSGDYVINSPGNPKVHGQVIPARFFNTEEGHRFDFGGYRGTPTNRYDMLQGARQ